MTAPPARIERKAFYLLLFVLLVAGCYVLLPFMETIVLAIAFTILFFPLHKKYLKWTKQRVNTAAMFSVVSVFFMLLIPVGAIFTLLTTQLANLIGSLTKGVKVKSLTGVISHLERTLEQNSDQMSLFGIQFDFVPLVTRGLERLSTVLSRYTINVLEDTLAIGLHLFIMIITMFYLFREGPDFFRTLVKLTPVRDKYEHRLAMDIKNTVNGVFYGSFLTAMIQAFLATTGFYFLGVEGFLVWGCLTFFMSFIPLIGTGATLVPIVLLFLVQGQWERALILSIYGVCVIGLVDNLLKPLLIKSNVHPLMLFLSVFGGLAVFGATGLLFGPMLFAMITAVVRIYDRDFCANGS